MSSVWPAVPLFALAVASWRCTCNKRKPRFPPSSSINNNNDNNHTTSLSPPLLASASSSSHATSSPSASSSSSKSATEPAFDHNLLPTWTSGETVRFSQAECSWDLLIERLPDSFLYYHHNGFREMHCKREDSVCVALARPSRPYDRLRVSNMETGILDWSGKADDKESCWVVTPQNSSGDVMLWHSSHSNKRGQRSTYNHVLTSRAGGWMAKLMPQDKNKSKNKDTEEVTCEEVTSEEGVHDDDNNFSSLPPWRVEALQAIAPVAASDMTPDTDRSLEPTPSLSDTQLQSFLHQGFLVLRQVVPPSVLNAAKKSVHARLGQPDSFVPYFDRTDEAKRRPPSGFDEVELPLEINSSGEQPLFNGRMAKDVSHDRDLLEPARCPEVQRYLAQLLGGHSFVGDINGVQVALRFPGEGNDALVMSGAAMKHSIRGDSWHTDGLRQGKKHSFTLLVGVALSDMTVPNHGNLCVWPKSHLHIHHWMREPDGMILRVPPVCAEGHPTGVVGYREDLMGEQPGGNEGYLDSDGALPDLGPPVQVLLQAGDVVLKHSEVGHCGAPHTGCDIRSMLYYRVRHSEWKRMHREHQMAADMWCDYAGLKHLADTATLREGCCHPPAMNDCAHVGQVTCGSCKDFVSMSTMNSKRDNTSWELYLDEANNYYYWYNEETGETKWDNGYELDDDEFSLGTPTMNQMAPRSPHKKNKKIIDPSIINKLFRKHLTLSEAKNNNKSSPRDSSYKKTYAGKSDEKQSISSPCDHVAADKSAPWRLDSKATSSDLWEDSRGGAYDDDNEYGDKYTDDDVNADYYHANNKRASSSTYTGEYDDFKGRDSKDIGNGVQRKNGQLKHRHQEVQNEHEREDSSSGHTQQGRRVQEEEEEYEEYDQSHYNYEEDEQVQQEQEQEQEQHDYYDHEHEEHPGLQYDKNYDQYSQEEEQEEPHYEHHRREGQEQSEEARQQRLLHQAWGDDYSSHGGEPTNDSGVGEQTFREGGGGGSDYYQQEYEEEQDEEKEEEEDDWDDTSNLRITSVLSPERISTPEKSVRRGVPRGSQGRGSSARGRRPPATANEAIDDSDDDNDGGDGGDDDEEEEEEVSTSSSLQYSSYSRISSGSSGKKRATKSPVEQSHLSSSSLQTKGHQKRSPDERTGSVSSGNQHEQVWGRHGSSSGFMSPPLSVSSVKSNRSYSSSGSPKVQVHVPLLNLSTLNEPQPSSRRMRSPVSTCGDSEETASSLGPGSPTKRAKEGGSFVDSIVESICDEKRHMQEEWEEKIFVDSLTLTEEVFDPRVRLSCREEDVSLLELYRYLGCVDEMMDLYMEFPTEMFLQYTARASEQAAVIMRGDVARHEQCIRVVSLHGLFRECKLKYLMEFYDFSQADSDVAMISVLQTVSIDDIIYKHPFVSFTSFALSHPLPKPFPADENPINSNAGTPGSGGSSNCGFWSQLRWLLGTLSELGVTTYGQLITYTTGVFQGHALHGDRCALRSEYIALVMSQVGGSYVKDLMQSKDASNKLLVEFIARSELFAMPIKLDMYFYECCRRHERRPGGDPYARSGPSVGGYLLRAETEWSLHVSDLLQLIALGHVHKLPAFSVAFQLKPQSSPVRKK